MFSIIGGIAGIIAVCFIYKKTTKNPKIKSYLKNLFKKKEKLRLTRYQRRGRHDNNDSRVNLS